MQWAELDLDAATWTLQPERRKTGRKDPEAFVIRLHPAAIEIIQRQPVFEDSPARTGALMRITELERQQQRPMRELAIDPANKEQKIDCARSMTRSRVTARN